ncbi:MAG: isochorismate synthase, partial [Thermobifida sp.]|nr:isochorismate synthase [Thermobifida sp.]
MRQYSHVFQRAAAPTPTMEPMHNDFGCSRLVFRALVLPPQHPGSTCSLTSLLPDSGGAAWLGERRQMIGLGRALTIESATPSAIAD